MGSWATARLGDVTRIRTGKLDAGASSADGPFPFFTCSREALRINTYSYDCECVLVGGNGELHVKYYDGKFDAYQRTYIIESLNKDVLHVPYLYFFLLDYVDALRSRSIGGVVKYIKLGHLAEAAVPLPPIEEQRRIADALREAAELAELRRRQLEELERLVRSMYYDMFGDPAVNEQGWDVVPFVGVLAAKPQNGLFAKAGAYAEDGNAEVIWINDFIDRRACELGRLRRVKAAPADVAKFQTAYGDLLFCRSSLTEAGVGKCAYVPQDVRPNTLFECHIIRVKADMRRVHPVFLQAQTMTELFRGQILANAKRSTMTTIGQDGIAGCRIVVPPLDLQRRFADIAADIDAQQRVVRQALDDTQQLYDSLTSRYFGQGERRQLPYASVRQ